MRRVITDIEIQAIKDGIKKHPLSMRKAAQTIGIPYRTFIYRAKKVGMYTPNQSGLGTEKLNHHRKKTMIPLQDVLLGKYPTYHTNDLKRRLVKEGVLAYKCNSCSNIGLWNDKPLTLQLNHIDGNHYNHKKENLEFLCPNCHTQTETWGTRNRNKKCVTDDEMIEALISTKNITQAIQKLGISGSKTNHERAKKLKLRIKGLVM